MAVPGDLTCPSWKWAGAWGWRAEQAAAKLAQLYGKTIPWFLEMAPQCLIPAGLSCGGGGSLLSWKGDADDRSESRQARGEAGRNGACSWMEQLFRWGEAGHPTKSCQLLGFSHPGLFGVAETVFDVLFAVVLLGH